MDFETYLRSKKINPLTFQEAEPVRWHEFKLVFDQVHPDSFTAQKLFLINGIRRKYPLPEEAPENKTGNTDEKLVKPKPKLPAPSSATDKPKPKMIPKVKIAPKIKKNE